MRTIRTTMQPTVEIEVSEKEYLDLSRQGLVQQDPDETNELTPENLADAVSKLAGNYGPGQPRTRTAKQDEGN